MTPIDVNLSDYTFSGVEEGAIEDLRTLSDADKRQLLMAGVDVDRNQAQPVRSCTSTTAACTVRAHNPGVEEIMDIKSRPQEIRRPGPSISGSSSPPTRTSITRSAYGEPLSRRLLRAHGEKGAKITSPVQSCLFLKGQKAWARTCTTSSSSKRTDSELHIITGCAVSATEVTAAAHLGISEFFVKKGGKLTFTMIHNWGDGDGRRAPAQRKGVVEAGRRVPEQLRAACKPVGNLQILPVHRSLVGQGAARTLQLRASWPPTGSHINSGSRRSTSWPRTRAGEIVSRTLTTGGTIIAPGRFIRRPQRRPRAATWSARV